MSYLVIFYPINKMSLIHKNTLLIAILLIIHSYALVPNRQSVIVSQPVGMDLSEN